MMSEVQLMDSEDNSGNEILPLLNVLLTQVANSHGKYVLHIDITPQ